MNFIMFRKVLAGDYNTRYIDSEGKWWKAQMDGRFRPSRPMPIIKEYGPFLLLIVPDDTPGFENNLRWKRVEYKNGALV